MTAGILTNVYISQAAFEQAVANLDPSVFARAADDSFPEMVERVRGSLGRAAASLQSSFTFFEQFTINTDVRTMWQEYAEGVSAQDPIVSETIERLLTLLGSSDGTSSSTPTNVLLTPDEGPWMPPVNHIPHLIGSWDQPSPQPSPQPVVVNSNNREEFLNHMTAGILMNVDISQAAFEQAVANLDPSVFARAADASFPDVVELVRGSVDRAGASLKSSYFEDFTIRTHFRMMWLEYAESVSAQDPIVSETIIRVLSTLGDTEDVESRKSQSYHTAKQSQSSHESASHPIGSSIGSWPSRDSSRTQSRTLSTHESSIAPSVPDSSPTVVEPTPSAPSRTSSTSRTSDTSHAFTDAEQAHEAERPPPRGHRVRERVEAEAPGPTAFYNTLTAAILADMCPTDDQLNHVKKLCVRPPDYGHIPVPRPTSNCSSKVMQYLREEWGANHKDPAKRKDMREIEEHLHSLSRETGSLAEKRCNVAKGRTIAPESREMWNELARIVHNPSMSHPNIHSVITRTLACIPDDGSATPPGRAQSGPVEGGWLGGWIGGW